MTREQFKEQMEWFAEYYEKKLTKVQAETWFHEFGNIDEKKFKEALQRHIHFDESPFFPAIGRIHLRISESRTVADFYPRIP